MTNIEGPHGLMFHHFHDAKHPRIQGSLSAEEFAELLNFVGRRHILPAEEWQRRALAGRLGEDDLCLTLDDNLRCQFDVVLPVLRDLGLTAFWFVYTSPLEGVVEKLEVHRYFRNVAFDDVEAFYRSFFETLTKSPHAELAVGRWHNFDPARYLAEFFFYSDEGRRFRFARDQILGVERYDEIMDRMMAEVAFDVEATAEWLWMGAAELRQLTQAGHVIGLHSHTHPTDLKILSATRQAAEYRRNLEILQTMVSVAPTVMAHPTNSYNDDTLQLLRDLGVRLGFRSNLAMREHGPLEHPRRDHCLVMAEMREAREVQARVA